MIENPLNSLMWKTKWFVKFFQECRGDVQFADMQMCMHGGERDKKSRLAFGGGIDLSPMAVMCDRSHEHKPWGFLRVTRLFATAEERNYPKLFCKRIAKAAALAANIPKKRKVLEDQEQKLGAAKQPRKKFRDLILEFKVTEEVTPLNVRSEGGKIQTTWPVKSSSKSGFEGEQNFGSRALCLSSAAMPSKVKITPASLSIILKRRLRKER